MEPESSLPHSQASATHPYPGLAQSNASPRNTPPRRSEWGSSLPPDIYIYIYIHTHTYFFFKESYFRPEDIQINVSTVLKWLSKIHFSGSETPWWLTQATNIAFTQIQLTWQYLITAIVISQQTQQQAYMPIRLDERHTISAMQMDWIFEMTNRTQENEVERLQTTPT